MSPKQRVYAAVQGQPVDRVPVTPIFMAWSAHFIGKTYRDYYLDGDVLARAQLAVTEAFELDQVMAISDPWREAEGYGMAVRLSAGGWASAGPRIRSRDDAKNCAARRVRGAAGCCSVCRAWRSLARGGRTHSVWWVEGDGGVRRLRGMQESMLD